MQFEVEIINHLITHYSNVLLKKVVEIAKARNEILVFLDSDGNISFDLPERDMSNDADAEAKEMREQLEATLEHLCTDTTKEIDVELNSKKMVIYRISPEAFNEAINDIDEVDRFLMEDEKLRTPLSQKSTPRTSTSSRRRSTSVNFSLSGSAGTPLGHRGFFSSAIVERDVSEDIERHVTTQFSSPTKIHERLVNLRYEYSHEDINELLCGYLEDKIKEEVIDIQTAMHPLTKLDGNKDEAAIGLFIEGVRASLNKQITTVIPINTTRQDLSDESTSGGSHWIVLIIQAGDPVQLTLIDSLGRAPSHVHSDIIALIHSQIDDALNVTQRILDQQHGDVDCGPWLVDNVINFVNGVDFNSHEKSVFGSDLRKKHQEKISLLANTQVRKSPGF